jgi:hypothetical protein
VTLLLTRAILSLLSGFAPGRALAPYLVVGSIGFCMARRFDPGLASLAQNVDALAKRAASFRSHHCDRTAMATANELEPLCATPSSGFV